MENNLLEENKETAGTLVAERAVDTGIGGLGGVGNVGAQAQTGTGTQAVQQAQAGTGTGDNETGDTRQDSGNGNAVAGTLFERQLSWMDKADKLRDDGVSYMNDIIDKIGVQPIESDGVEGLSDDELEILDKKWYASGKKFYDKGWGLDNVLKRIGNSPVAVSNTFKKRQEIWSRATKSYENWRLMLITGDNYRRFKESGENDAEKEKLYENAYIAKGLEAMGMQVSAPERVDEMFGKDGVLGVEKRDFLTFLGEFEKFDGKLKVAADFYGSSPTRQENILKRQKMTREEFEEAFVPQQVKELTLLLPCIDDEGFAKNLVQMCVMTSLAKDAPYIGSNTVIPDTETKYREYYHKNLRDIFMGLKPDQQVVASRIIRNVCKETYSGFWESLFGKGADTIEDVFSGYYNLIKRGGQKLFGTPVSEMQDDARSGKLFKSLFSREYEKNLSTVAAGSIITAGFALGTYALGKRISQPVALTLLYGIPTVGNTIEDNLSGGTPFRTAFCSGLFKGAGEVASEYVGNSIIFAKNLAKSPSQVATRVAAGLLKSQNGWKSILKGAAEGVAVETGEEFANAAWGTLVDYCSDVEDTTADLEAFKDNFGEIVLSSLLMMGGGHAIVKARAVKDYIDNGSSFKEALMTPATPWGAMKAANKAEADANKIGVAMGMLKSKLVADQENGHIQMVKIAGDAVNQIDLTEWAKLGIAEREQVIRERFFGGEKFGKSDIVNAGEILDFVAARTKEAETQAKSAIDEAKPMTGDEMQAAQAAVERATGKQAGTETAGTETAGTETAGTGAVQQAQTAGTGDNETGDARQEGVGLSYDDFVFAVKRDSSFLDVNRYAPGLSIAADVSAALGNGISGADKGRVAILKDVFGREDWKPFKKLAFVRHYNRLAAGTANPVSAGTGTVYNKTELLNRALREFSDGFGEGIKMPEGETLPEEVLPASDVDLVDDGWKDVFFDNGTREALSILRNLGVDISPNDMIGFFGGNVLAGTDFEARKAFVSEVAQGMASHAVSASAEGKRISRRSMTEAVNERLAKRYGNVADYVERRAETMKLIESDSVKVMADSFLRRQGLSDVLKDLKLRVVGEINDETWGEFEKQLREAGCQATREDLEGRAWNGFSFGNTIFINEKVAAKEGFTKTLGHEIWHFLKSNVDEGEWKALRDRLLSGEVFNGYLWHFENVLNARDGLGTVLNLDGLLQQKRSLYSDVMTKSGVGAEAVEDYLREEVSADVVGWLLFSHEPRLVAKAAKKPGFKERIKEWLRLFVGSVRGLRVENEAKRALAGFESLLAGERAGTGDNETGDTRRTGTRDGGNEFEVLTPNKGRRVKVKGEYRVVDSSDINFVDITQTGAQNEQQRDRNTGRTSAQSDEILANFYPEMLLDNKSTGSGAPLVREIEGGKLLSVSGHGRSLTLRELHSRGKNPEDVKARANLDNYLNAVRAFCREHGIEFDEKIENPVLVRVGLEADNGNDWAEVSQLSNEDDKIRQTRGEQAQNDSLKITDELLAKIPVGVEAKNIADTEYNLEFISAFNDLVKAGQDYKNDAANNFNELMAERALDAIFAYLINDRGVVRDVLDRYTMTFREQVSDIQDLAVRILLMNERGNGNREFYVGNEVRHAFAAAAYAKKTNNRAREQGTKVRNIEGLIASYFQDLGFKDKRIGSGEIDCDVNIAEALAVMMMKNGGKRHECKNVLANYLSIVETERGVSGNEFDMFAPAKTKREYFDAALAAFAESKKKKRSGDDDGVFSLERGGGNGNVVFFGETESGERKFVKCVYDVSPEGYDVFGTYDSLEEARDEAEIWSADNGEEVSVYARFAVGETIDGEIDEDGAEWGSFDDFDEDVQSVIKERFPVAATSDSVFDYSTDFEAERERDEEAFKEKVVPALKDIFEADERGNAEITNSNGEVFNLIGIDRAFSDKYTSILVEVPEGREVDVDGDLRDRYFVKLRIADHTHNSDNGRVDVPVVIPLRGDPTENKFSWKNEVSSIVFHGDMDKLVDNVARKTYEAVWDVVENFGYFVKKDAEDFRRFSLERAFGEAAWTPEFDFGGDDGDGAGGAGSTKIGGVGDLGGVGAQAGAERGTGTGAQTQAGTEAETGDKETRDTRQEGNAGTGTPDGGNGFEKVKVDGSTFEISRGMPLRLLNPGEKCYAERQFTKNGEFDLTGGEKIESVQDVAFLFRSLKSEAVAHSFFVCVDKNGKAVAVHAGMSADSRGVFDVDTALNSVLELNPERVYFVRNHPDGDLTPDKMEVGFFREIRDGIKRISDKKIPITAIILDTYKNQFFTFDGNGIKNTEYENFSGKIDEKNYDVHEFNKSVFTDEFYKIKSCSDGLDVAEFIASQRLGKRGCLNFLTMTGDRKVSGAYCLPQASVEEVLNDKELLGRILNRAYRSSALFVVFYGDIPGEKEKIASCFGKFNIYCTFWDSPAGEKYSLSRGGNGNDGNGNGALSAGAGVFDEIIRRRNEKYSDIGNVRLLKVLGAAAAQVILNDGSTVVGDVVAADVCRGNEWMIDDVKTFGGFVAGVVREALKDSGRKASFDDVVKAVDLVSRMRAMKRLDDAVSPFDGNAIDSMKKSVKTRAGAGRNVRAVSVGAKNVDALNLGSRIFTVGLQRDAGTEEQNVRNSMDAERERRRADEDTRNNKKDRKLPESSGKPQRAVETDGWKGFEDVGNLKGNDSFEAMTDDLVRLCADAVFGKGKVEDVRAVEAFLERPEVSVEQAERFVKTLRGTAAAEITKIMQRSVAKHSQRPVYGCIQAIVQENNVSIIMQAIDRAFSTIARNKVSESRAEVYERLAKLVKTGGAFKSKELDENRKLGGRTELFLKYCRDVFFDDGNTMISTIDKIRKLESRIIELSERMDLDAAELNELDNGRMMMTALRLLGGAKTKSAVELEDVYFELERAIEVAADTHEADVEKERERRERERAPLIAAMRAGTRLGENQDSIVRDVVNLARGTTSVKQQLESFAKFADGNERKEALAAAKLFSDKISDASSIRDGLSFERANTLQERMEALFGGTEAMEAFMRDFNKESAEIGNEFSANKTPMSKARLAFVYAQVRQEHYGKPLTLPDEEIAGLSDDVRAKLDLIQKRIKQIPRMEEVLGEQGVAVVDTLCEMLDERKGALQEAFKEMTGYAFDMNEVYNGKAAYFPIFRTGRGEALRSGGISVDAVPVRLNGRVMSFQDISEEYNIFTVFDSVSGGNEHFIAYRNVVRDYQALFADDDFVDAAKYHIGKDIYQQFREHVQQVLTNKKRADKNVFDRTIDKITSATSMVCLGGNMLVTLRQTTSIPAFLFNMEGTDFLKALYSAGTKEGWETMKMLYKECPWMIQRRNRGFDAARAKAFREESWLKQKSAKLGAWYMFNNQLGDMVPILIVGQGIYRAAYAGALKHMGVDESTASEEQKAAAKQKAFSVFAAAADMSQQAGRIENSGASQRSGGSFGRAINQFKSTSQQFLSYDFRASEDFVNLVWRGLKKWRSGEKTFEDFVKETAADDRTKELGKVLFVNHVLLPGFYCLMTMIFDLMIGGDPDDWTEDWFKNFALPMILGPMSGLYFLGFGLANVWNRKHVGTSVPGIETLQKAHYFVDAVKDCFDDEKETDDVINDLDNGMRSLFPFYRHMSQAYENYTEDDY